MSIDTQRIVEFIIVLSVILSPLWLIRPFRFEPADRKAHRLRKRGVFSARVVRKWYGWIVVTDENKK